MRRTLAAILPALLLAACAEPVLVPEAGPNAPGYTPRSLAPPPAPRVRVEHDVVRKAPPDGGAVDSVVRDEGSFDIVGWALLDASSPRGTLRVVLPKGVDASVQTVESVARPDVVTATGKDTHLWAGFTITVRGTLPSDAGVCVLSRSTQGTFRLGGSDEDLCPA